MRVVWYHDNCYDGFGAAYAVWKSFGYADVEYRGVQYGRPPPELPAETEELYLLDVTFPLDDMERLAVRVPLTVIDHHVTAEAALKALECKTKIFDLNHSGSYLTYRYFYDRYPCGSGARDPLLFRYLEDRDLWRFRLPDSREINCYVKSFAFDFNVWLKVEEALHRDFRQCVLEGAAILRMQQQTVEMMCRKARFDTIGNHSVPVVNATAFWSEVGEELMRRYPDAQFVASYFDRDDGARVYSLRSSDRFDCSVVAQRFGGGGHARAAGFVRS